MVGPVMQALLCRLGSLENAVSDRDSSSREALVHDSTLDDAIASMPTPDISYFALNFLAPLVACTNGVEGNINVGDEQSGNVDLEDGFELPPPALALEDDFVYGLGFPFIIADGLGGQSDRTTIRAWGLSATEAAHHLAALQLVPDSTENSSHGATEEAADGSSQAATEETVEGSSQAATEEEVEDEPEGLEVHAAIQNMNLGKDQLTISPPCSQRFVTKLAAASLPLPCGTTVRVGRRRVAARRPRQAGLVGRREVAASCGLPSHTNTGRRRRQTPGTTH